MAIIKKTVKTLSTLIGEALVVGGALGTAYVLGFIKGSEAKPMVESVVEKVEEACMKTVKTEEPATEQEAESTTESDASPIEVSVNNQPED